nr:hypothetical protein [Amycolatopsis niigatensis]
MLNEDYAVKIARDWNVRCGRGGETVRELWVPAEELGEFNAHLVTKIEVVHEFR